MLEWALRSGRALDMDSFEPLSWGAPSKLLLDWRVPPLYRTGNTLGPADTPLDPEQLTMIQRMPPVTEALKNDVSMHLSHYLGESVAEQDPMDELTLLTEATPVMRFVGVDTPGAGLLPALQFHVRYGDLWFTPEYDQARASASGPVEEQLVSSDSGYVRLVRDGLNQPVRLPSFKAIELDDIEDINVQQAPALKKLRRELKNFRGVQSVAPAKTTRRVKQLPADMRLCLTGTPLENHLGELWSIADCVLPGLLGDDQHFAKHFRQPIEQHGDSQRAQELSHRLAPFMLRRTKAEVVKELPAKTNILQTVHLEGKQQALYESIRVSMEKHVRQLMKEKGLAKSRIEFLDALLKLRQACIDPRLVNQLLASLQHPPIPGSIIKFSPRALRAVHPRGLTPELPAIGLAQPWLFTAGKDSPALLHELQAELNSCNHVDILVSFITVYGVRKLLDRLKAITATDGQGRSQASVRVLTTTYAGATDQKALNQLAELPNCEVRVSLERLLQC